MLLVTSAFLWAKRDLPAATGEQNAVNRPWLVFCSPPYAFYQERQAEMLDLIRRIREHAPAGSILIVEAEEGADFEPIWASHASGETAGTWDVRKYSPALIGVWRKG